MAEGHSKKRGPFPAQEMQVEQNHTQPSVARVPGGKQGSGPQGRGRCSFTHPLVLFTRFRSKMTAAGFTISGKDHPICPVMLGDARLAAVMAEDMLNRGEPGREL